MQRIELRAGVGGTIALSLVAILCLPLALITPLAGKIFFGITSALLLLWAVAIASRKLFVDDVGVTAKGLFGEKRIEWNEVEYYTFWSMDQQHAVAVGAGAQGGLLGVLIASLVIAAVNSKRKTNDLNRRFSNGRLKIVSRGRKTSIPIDLRYKDPVAALERSFEELHSRMRAAPSRNYDPFQLGQQQLVHKYKGTIAFAEIEKVEVTGGQLIVKKRGKRLAWAKCAMRDLSNGLLFIEELAEHGLVVNAQAGMFVPPSILEKLLAAASRQAALPQARVVERS